MTNGTKAPDLCMWVGHKFYPTADDYIKEAMTLGCSKRVPMLPEDVVPGRSRVFLAHDDGKKGQGRIFGFFVLQGVEIIIDDPDKIAEYQRRFANLNVQTISSAQAAAEPKRLCGQRAYGASYLVSTPDMNTLQAQVNDLAGKADIKGELVILLNPIPFPLIRWRGWRYMEPQWLAKYDWPQISMPVTRAVKVEPPNPKQKILPLFGGTYAQKS